MNKLFIKRKSRQRSGTTELTPPRQQPVLFEIYDIYPTKYGDKKIERVYITPDSRHKPEFDDLNNSNNYDFLFLTDFVDINHENNSVVIIEEAEVVKFSPKTIRFQITNVAENDTNWEEKRIVLRIEDLELVDGQTTKMGEYFSLVEIGLFLEEWDDWTFGELRTAIEGRTDNTWFQIVFAEKVNFNFEHVEDLDYTLHIHNKPAITWEELQIIELIQPQDDADIPFLSNTDTIRNIGRQREREREREQPNTPSPQRPLFRPVPNVPTPAPTPEKTYQEIKFTTGNDSNKVEASDVIDYHLVVKTPFAWKYQEDDEDQQQNIEVINLRIGETETDESKKLLEADKEITMEIESFLIPVLTDGKWELVVTDYKNVKISDKVIIPNNPDIPTPNDQDGDKPTPPNQSPNSPPTPPKPNKDNPKDKDEPNNKTPTPNQKDQSTTNNENDNGMLKPILIIGGIFLVVGLIAYSIKRWKANEK